ncbi:MAG: SH3 domain-containing protein [Lachnospiraceae bacterium]|nr:SH3 domain-containing protein [Lachnospiraceae bacterium]
MIKRKFLAFGIAISMSSMLIAGCGDKALTTSTTPKQKTTTEKATEKETETTTEKATEKATEVETTTEASTEAPTPAITVEEVSATLYSVGCNVRSGDGTNYDKIGYANWGDALAVTGQTPSGWYRISYNGVDGYVSADLVQATAPVKETQPAQSSNSGSGNGGSYTAPAPQEQAQAEAPQTDSSGDDAYWEAANNYAESLMGEGSMQKYNPDFTPYTAEEAATVPYGYLY